MNKKTSTFVFNKNNINNPVDAVHSLILHCEQKKSTRLGLRANLIIITDEVRVKVKG